MLVETVKSFTNSLPRQEASGRDFALKCADVIETVNKENIHIKRGQLALEVEGGYANFWRYCLSESGSNMELLQASIPTEILYPWTIDGQACMIAGKRVQLISTAKASAFVTAGRVCTDILKRICVYNFQDRSLHVYDALVKAINAVKTGPRFYAHSAY